MLKRGTFIRNKYYWLLAGSLFGAVANGVNTMLDAVLSGIQLGETALTAVSIVTPLSTLIYFFATIYTPGYGILYGKYNGEFDTKKAHQTAGQSLVTSSIVGALLVLAMLAFKQPFLRYYGCSGALYAQASIYYNWKMIMAVLLPFANGLYYLLAADGDTLLISIGGIASILTHIISSNAFCRRFGIAGLGMGTVLCTIVVLIFYGLHFLRKTNSIRFKLCFHLKEFRKSVKLSGAISCSFLFVALTDIIMNKVILISCGVSMITAYSIVNLVYAIFEIYSAPYSAAGGLVSTFLGERNHDGIKAVLSTTFRTAAGIGLVLSALLLVFGPQLPKVYGMESPEIIEASARAARCMAMEAVPYGIAYIIISIYPSFGNVKLGIVMSFLNDFFCPLALAIPLAFLFGFTGVSIGIGANGFLVLALFSLYVIQKYGKKDFPYYLTGEEEEAVSFDLMVTPESIVELQGNVRAELEKRGFAVKNIEILIEELYTRISEKNPGKKILSECALLFHENQVRVVIRDNGVLFNFTDEDNKVESLNSYVLSSLLAQTKSKNYVLTTSFNRNAFVFTKE